MHTRGSLLLFCWMHTCTYRHYTVVSWSSFAPWQWYLQQLQTQCNSIQLTISVAPPAPHWQSLLLCQSQWSQQSTVSWCRLGLFHTGLDTEWSQWTHIERCRQRLHHQVNSHLLFFQLVGCLSCLGVQANCHYIEKWMPGKCSVLPFLMFIIITYNNLIPRSFHLNYCLGALFIPNNVLWH